MNPFQLKEEDELVIRNKMLIRARIERARKAREARKRRNMAILMAMIIRERAKLDGIEDSPDAYVPLMGM